MHHFVSTIAYIGPIINLFSGNITLYIISVIINIIIQTGFLINNDYCWLTRSINKKIDPIKPNRKWRADLYSFIKHYIRGDSWAYSDIYKNSFTPAMLVLNCIYIFGIVKLYIYSKLLK